MTFAQNVFINCPFDRQYQPLFLAVVFTVFDCGFRAKCALEISDSGELRMKSIMRLISGSRYSIHDISRTELDRSTGLPRLNMPFELGLTLGSRAATPKKRKQYCVVFDTTRFRYRKFISDLSGYEIKAHGSSQRKLVSGIRDFLRDSSRRNTIPGGSEIYGRYKRFERDLPLICRNLRIKGNEMTINDLVYIISSWLKQFG